MPVKLKLDGFGSNKGTGPNWLEKYSSREIFFHKSQPTELISHKIVSLLKIFLKLNDQEGCLDWVLLKEVKNLILKYHPADSWNPELTKAKPW